ncbi:esterase/lipase family protein [Algisphaera agarilytica]|uniref:Pimeloyl-ACP methyl ester carboxylesterase n=1 Tax=Algisphaera agarilytica TaxID=1385975 RepID=A0A7X0H9C1_9BACT|nr:hypothetical protein [Algisphaera agarilytica]MBB6431674.1 pimeloyl-ACP methyl ester carboxylesterase [Algisphaera agarilytica]
MTKPPGLILATVLLASAFTIGGCAARQVNPSFPVTEAQAKTIIKDIESDGRPLDRPVVVLAGWADPGFVNSYWSKQLRKVGVPEDQVVGLEFVFEDDFEDCRDHVIESVQEVWLSDETGWTSEVDVVAFSMGGLVARYSASPSKAEGGAAKRRLKIRNLYTISTPHRGAVMAGVPTLDRRVIDMREGSAFLAHLDECLAEARYTLIPYTRLDDPIVGSERTAPAGLTPWWVDTPPLHRSHQEAYRDPRIRADILRRLRGEETLVAGEPAAFPE